MSNSLTSKLIIFIVINARLVVMIDFCYLFAGYGRSRNEEYRLFLALLEETKTNNNAENKV